LDDAAGSQVYAFSAGCAVVSDVRPTAPASLIAMHDNEPGSARVQKGMEWLAGTLSARFCHANRFGW
jgi:hypothetical protein